MTFSASDLQADVAVLRDALETLHPGLLRYNDAKQIDADFKQLGATLDRTQSLESAYLAFSQFEAKLQCGHCYANFFNQDPAIAKALFQGQNRVPFFFEWIDGEMVVTRDFTASGVLPRGARVVAINGTSSKQILTTLMTVARADGSNNAKRVNLLGVRGDETYETFDVFFPMFFHQRSPQLQVSAIGVDGRPFTVTVPALTYEQRRSAVPDTESGSNAAFEWRYLPNGAAYLRMPTWALFNSTWDWKSWLAAHLDELAAKNPPAFVIDVRGNEGGLDEIGDAILQRLVPANLRVTPLKQLVRYRSVPARLLPFLHTWNPSFKDWGSSAVALQHPWPTAPHVPFFALERGDDAAEMVLASGKRYAGPVFVLVDASNSSATFNFAHTAQQAGLAKLAGQPTGGNRQGIDGGAFFFLHLPKSKIEVDIPLIGTFPATPQPDAGLQPDIDVPLTARDIAAARDAVLDAVDARITR